MQEIVIAILSREDDPIWLTQEMTMGTTTSKPLFLIIREDVNFKAGILGDIEYVRFPISNFS